MKKLKFKYKNNWYILKTDGTFLIQGNESWFKVTDLKMIELLKGLVVI